MHKNINVKVMIGTIAGIYGMWLGCSGEDMCNGDKDCNSGQVCNQKQGLCCGPKDNCFPQNSSSDSSTTDLSTSVMNSSTGDSGGEGESMSQETVCGNGEVDADEECDDGNLNNQDACLSTCKRASCGDGFVNKSNIDKVEECDLGGDQNDGTYKGCNVDCTLAGYCGDGILQQGDETCDPNDLKNPCPDEISSSYCKTDYRIAFVSSVRCEGASLNSSNIKYKYKEKESPKTYYVSPDELCNFLAIANESKVPAYVKNLMTTTGKWENCDKKECTFKAWLRYNAVDTQIVTPYSWVPQPQERLSYVTLDRENNYDKNDIVAKTWQDFFFLDEEDSLRKPINVNEKGELITDDTYVWSGVSKTGGEAGDNCGDWKFKDDFWGAIGDLTANDSSWTDANKNVKCEEYHRIYCVQVSL